MSTNTNNSRQKELLNGCLRKIENKLEWSNAGEWRHSHFELLSEKIFEETKIRLSAVTLKRVWGKVSYHSFPSISTLDALARFIGYENWISYQQASEKSQQKSKHQQRQSPRQQTKVKTLHDYSTSTKPSNHLIQIKQQHNIKTLPQSLIQQNYLLDKT